MPAPQDDGSNITSRRERRPVPAAGSGFRAAWRSAAGFPDGDLSQAGRSHRSRSASRRCAGAGAFQQSARSSLAALFEGSALKLVRSPAPGSDRLDQAEMTRLGIPVANVTGQRRRRRICDDGGDAARCAGSPSRTPRSSAATMCLLPGPHDRRQPVRARRHHGRHRGLYGVIGRATATAFHRAGCRICYYDPAPPMPVAAAAAAADRSRSSQPRPAAAGSRRGEPRMCRSLPIDHRPDRRRELARMKRDAVLIQAARGAWSMKPRSPSISRRADLAGPRSTSTRPSRRQPTIPLLTAHRRGRPEAAPDPAYRAASRRQSSAFLFRSAWDNVERVLVRNEPPHRPRVLRHAGPFVVRLRRTSILAGKTTTSNKEK